MAYVYDNKTYRNLQQQVKENMDDIARLQSLKLVGLDVSYIVDTEEDLADITAEQGMVVAVGTEQPYTLFVYNDSSWVDFGEFPKAGPQGEQGPQGQVGNPGPRGLTGEPGPRGYTGAAGPAGQPGPAGPRGVQGPKGDKGDPGLVDAFAADAESITAVGQAYVDADGYLQVCTSLSPLTFEQGGYVKGPQGEQGIQGPQGIQGEQGVQGPKGDTGPQGEKGAKGDTGARGPEGPQGIQGPQGETGATGPEGAQGPRGPEGAQGPTGPTGPQGPKGDPGLTASVEVNGQVYTTDATGKITLPDYPADVAWGNITGTLSSQTDLQTALDAKADASSIGDATIQFTVNNSIVGNLTTNATTNKTISLGTKFVKYASDNSLYVDALGAASGWWQNETISGEDTDYDLHLFANGIEILDYEDVDDNAPYYIGFQKKTGTLALTSDIPTVGNAILTIQKNGAQVGTFTANATTNKTINITVPTTTSELTNNSGFITSSAVPTATSQLTNDSGFITSSAIPTNYVTTDTQQSITASKTIYGDLRVTDDDDKTIDLIANQTGGPRIEIDDEYETSILSAGELTLKNSNSYAAKIDVSNLLNSNITLVLPTSTGTLALTSDIPSLAYYVTTNTAQNITGVKTFNNGIKFNFGSNYNNGWIRRTSGSSISILPQQVNETVDLNNELQIISTDGNNLFVGPKNNATNNLGSSSTAWTNLYLSGNITDGTNSIAVANIADKTNSETWTFTLSDNTTVTKTIVLG